MEILSALGQALTTVFSPGTLLMLVIGVLFGAVIAIIPGLGSIAGIAICLPFIWKMDPVPALALLTGLVAVMRTADTIPAVLFAVPGTAGCITTLLDGYPMARKGLAAQALGAAYLASTTGALISALVLLLLIPVANFILPYMNAAVFFMLILWGITMVGGLSGKRPQRGITAALLGMLLSSIGGTAGAYQLRYTFDQTYLYDGIPLLAVALGLFALPEIVELLTSSTTISTVPLTNTFRQQLEGMKAVLRHWGLVLRSSLIGTFIGFLPGLGAGPAAWIAYGHAVQTSKDRSNFGKGEMKGIVAPESANNAADGGAFIPALFFGIPGSGTMAVMLYAFQVLDVIPGRAMLTTQLNLTMTIVWSLTIGAVMAFFLCMGLVRPFAWLTTVRMKLMAPFIIIMVILAAFQAKQNWLDLFILLILAGLGWIMKRTGWPRPPVLIGFILGPMAERYLWICVSRWGLSWLLQPAVIVIGLVIIGSMILAFRQARTKPAGS